MFTRPAGRSKAESWTGAHWVWNADVGRALLGALLMAGASTVADAVWAFWGLRHRSLYGLVHGSLLLLVFGVYVGVLGRAKRSLLLGFLGGPAAGLAAAGSFYLLEPFLGYSAMFAAWAFLWVLLGILVRFVVPYGQSWRQTLLRGIAAALFSGLAFYGISDIWLKHSPRGPNYLYHFLCWTWAYLPGFLALLFRSQARRS
jgi:hypothetical protein